MITFFSTPRPFINEFDQLQRQAIKSWRNAVHGCQVILLGDEEGMKEAAADLGAVHIPSISLNEYGTPLFNDLFTLAEMFADNDLLCEISADIVLDANFALALEAIKEVDRPFVIGQRWDIEPGGRPDSAKLHPPVGIDYFLYRRGTLGEIPPFAVGRTAYDNWIVWAAIERWGLTVIDATKTITAIHINHGYHEFKNGKSGMLAGEERRENHRLVKETGCNRLYGVNDTPYVMRAGKILKKGLA